PWSIMCSNNEINGVYACENRRLLSGVLEGEWKFDGVVGSDYAATHSAVGAVQAGLDQSFTLRDWGAAYRDLPRLVRSGKVAEATIDERVRRVLLLMFRVGLFDPDRQAPPKIDRTAHAAVARRVAQEGSVLLRNGAGLLPLNANTVRSIAVVGPYAATAHPGGGGSSRVVPFHTVSPVQGITSRVGSGVRVTTDDGADPARAAAAARAADVAVVVVGDVTKEGRDRPSMDLPGTQNALIRAVTAANPRTVVVLQTGSAVTMPWLGQVRALLETWYPGQEGGSALAAVLFGDADPSGRLPVTFPTDAAQSPSMGAPRYPAGRDGYDYTERLNVGYRGFDSTGRTPLFLFGYGLSYASFAYTKLAATRVGSGVQVALTVTNTGKRTGVAVPQVYLGFPAAAGEPPRQLRGFDRLLLTPGASQRVTITLDRHAFEYWGAAGWQTATGGYQVWAGASSRDLPLSARLSPG
ncbi:MAG: glycoside hydrolase family 3 C-terminal domain-containing protein, partial [Mycobacteriales bacterium]